MVCELCGSENLVYLGRLGFYWFRCQNCGIDQFTETKPENLTLISEEECEDGIR